MRNVGKYLQEVQEPGEYGQPHNPLGWSLIDLTTHNGGRLFLSSYQLINDLSNHYHIPPNNIVRLNQNPAIPEEPLAGEEGLTQFKNKLAVIQNTSEDVLIHCTRGNNRTPVAAYIYMVDRLNIPPAVARNLIGTAMEDRNPEFRLNSRDHYTEVINLVNEQYQKRIQDRPPPLLPPAPTTSNWKRISQREVDEVVQQAEYWKAHKW